MQNSSTKTPVKTIEKSIVTLYTYVQAVKCIMNIKNFSAQLPLNFSARAKLRAKRATRAIMLWGEDLIYPFQSMSLPSWLVVLGFGILEITWCILIYLFIIT